MDAMINLSLQLLKKGTDHPLTGQPFTVKLYDLDPIHDDLLGESKLDEEGRAHFTFSTSQYKSKDSPFERFPDLYFTLEKDGNEIFESKVFRSYNFEEEGNFSVKKGLQCNLGVFLI